MQVKIEFKSFPTSASKVFGLLAKMNRSFSYDADYKIVEALVDDEEFEQLNGISKVKVINIDALNDDAESRCTELYDKIVELVEEHNIDDIYIGEYAEFEIEGYRGDSSIASGYIESIGLEYGDLIAYFDFESPKEDAKVNDIVLEDREKILKLALEKVEETIEEEED